MATIPHNSLIVWKGGGYPGCIWEWNAAIVNEIGEFHPLENTGTGALKGIPGDVDRWKTEQSGQVFQLDLTGLKSFDSEYNADFVIDVMRYLDSIGVEVLSKCDNCGGYMNPMELNKDGFIIDGGLVEYATLKLCDKCS